MAEFITVGKVAAPFGIQGEIKVIPLTDFPERFSRGGSYYLSKQKMFKEVEIQGVKIRGREIIIKFEGIDTPEDARVYRNALLQVPRGEVLPLPEGHYYHYQIVGLLAATEDGTVLGKVAEILETGSNDVYLVKDDQGREILIPALKEVVREIDPDKGLMLVRPLPGLLED
ncbi:MAG TPA: 16S rRNA processing protein RimM [Syntrophaceticus sp.]|jgi:16S rRNA processing protein RimM|uniref:Ribosome maturation factor RimM n=1 Tax=Syntrophaceticus schinkii TaxID=499207 RepID=A0A0B7MKG7_9FIRM|nr:ribosome maturation factor RimM [Syntrophaceticus schinkii]HHY29622.1 16S rRNA processing protein RimM [Syntrophaceticus sp.]MDD2359658.1 ribosome maturation factor RimM [Syntrophaceticus schinkii]MDD4261305.1 ribosome maturation factor RimM [Syntrophaceticus schinkii]MDD4674650.1 ribosome maturation factor RimM [Syntrophaceticus schinkii]CEO88451.1 Ribosome maturation factor RimM [Syntrophaceticus schinkii]